MQLERQMDAARQLRAETLRGAALAVREAAYVALRRIMDRIAPGGLRQA